MKRSRTLATCTRLNREEEAAIAAAADVLGVPIPELVRESIFTHIEQRLAEHLAGARTATVALSAADSAPVTHGRHCPCSACQREDWTRTDLAPCGMHGRDCPDAAPEDDRKTQSLHHSDAAPEKEAFPEGMCPHARPHWAMCPHCLGTNHSPTERFGVESEKEER